jgi:HD-like signal output (HDOD) protein
MLTRDALVEIGVENSVTTFTHSDFGRTLTSNRDGSDHAWGGNQIVVGGAVRGGEIYGHYPSLVINGPQDVSGDRLIPTLSADQYAATLARWFGVSDANRVQVAPNVNNFTQPILGFLGFLPMQRGMVAPAANPNAAPLSAEMAAFVQELQAELRSGKVELPSFPEVSLQIQRLLRDDNVSLDKVVRLVGAEPILAGRVMQLASSAALNPRGTPILELRTAVTRLGFDSLRAAAISFAMLQLRLAPSFQGIQSSLAALWKDNVSLAATACVVARRCRRASPDTALFAGLVAGVGKICLLAKARRQPAMLNDSVAYHLLVRDWHAEVAQAVLHGWGIAEEICIAVGALHTRPVMRQGAAPLADVLMVADMLAFQHEVPDILRQHLEQEGSAARLGLAAADCLKLREESQSELAILQGALGQ